MRPLAARMNWAGPAAPLGSGGSDPVCAEIGADEVLQQRRWLAGSEFIQEGGLRFCLAAAPGGAWERWSRHDASPVDDTVAASRHCLTRLERHELIARGIADDGRGLSL